MEVTDARSDPMLVTTKQAKLDNIPGKVKKVKVQHRGRIVASIYYWIKTQHLSHKIYNRHTRTSDTYHDIYPMHRYFYLPVAPHLFLLTMKHNIIRN
jgi:hypothetical protein